MRAGKLEKGKIRVQIEIGERQKSGEVIVNIRAGGKRMFRADSL
jgi:hypothetical protein